ncbi:MAG TPA: hypothetical protein VF421_07710 [Niabella sp.]
MKLANPTGKTLEELQSGLSVLYPGTKIRKAFLGIGPNNLVVPVSGGLKHVIRPIKKNTLLVADFIPPVLIIIGALFASVLIISVIFTLIIGAPVIGGFGGVGFVLIFLAIKAIYKSANKEKFDRFYTDLNAAMTHSSQPGSIF